MRLASILIFYLALNGCNTELCENTILEKSFSLDSKFVATVFKRNCGATTPFITIISLRKKTDELNMENYKDWIFTAHDKANIKLSWKEENNLIIDFSTHDQNPTKKRAWNNIKISYEKN